MVSSKHEYPNRCFHNTWWVSLGLCMRETLLTEKTVGATQESYQETWLPLYPCCKLKPSGFNQKYFHPTELSQLLPWRVKGNLVRRLFSKIWQKGVKSLPHQTKKQSRDVEFHLQLPCGSFSSCCGGKSTASPGEAVTRRSGSSPPCDFKARGSAAKKNQSDSSTWPSETREPGRVWVRTRHNGHTQGYSAIKHIWKTTRKDLQVNAFKMISLF